MDRATCSRKNCPDARAPGWECCYAHSVVVMLGFNVDHVDRVADQAGITVAVLVREAIVKTLDALDRNLR